MREIKFRGLTSAGNQKQIWIYGSFVKYNNGDTVIFKGDMKYGSEATQITDRTLILSGTEGQYTGLKDKNGVEIYEGDILQTNDRPQAYVVDWINYMASWYPFCKEEINRKGFVFVVIGNIHQDKELLT